MEHGSRLPPRHGDTLETDEKRVEKGLRKRVERRVEIG
jgi:hypothetical protein